MKVRVTNRFATGLKRRMLAAATRRARSGRRKAEAAGEPNGEDRLFERRALPSTSNIGTDRDAFALLAGTESTGEET